MAFNLVEIDSLEVKVIVDNEVDPLSPSPNADVETPRPMRGIRLTPLEPGTDRGGGKLEMRMDSICHGAHGLSLMIVCIHLFLRLDFFTDMTTYM